MNLAHSELYKMIFELDNTNIILMMITANPLLRKHSGDNNKNNDNDNVTFSHWIND